MRRALLVALLACGCGVKAPPRPPEPERPQAEPPRAPGGEAPGTGRGPGPVHQRRAGHAAQRSESA